MKAKPCTIVGRFAKGRDGGLKCEVHSTRVHNVFAGNCNMRSSPPLCKKTLKGAHIANERAQA